MQAIDVLSHHGVELAGTLQLGQLSVAAVGLSVKRDHLGAVKVEELRRMCLVKAVREHSLGRIGKPLVIQAVHAAEIGDAARCGNTRAAKEDHVAMGFEQLRQRSGGLLGIRYCCLLYTSIAGGQRREHNAVLELKGANRNGLEQLGCRCGHGYSSLVGAAAMMPRSCLKDMAWEHGDATEIGG